MIGSFEPNTIVHGHALELARALPDNSIQAIITSPPYYGLRDYGLPPVQWPAVTFAPMAGLPEMTIPEQTCNLGLEADLWAYAGHLVALFRELRRALHPAGTLFLNLGDSYAGDGKERMGRMLKKSPSSVQREAAYGTSGIKPEDYQERGCLCKNLCGACREVYRHKFRTCDLLAPTLIASLSGSIRERMEFEFGHPPTLDLIQRVSHTLDAIQDSGRFFFHVPEQLRVFQESTPDEFSRQLLGECWQRGNCSFCLVCACSLTGDVREFAHKLGESEETFYDNQGSALHTSQPTHHNQGINKACDYCISYNKLPTNIIPQNTLKPKDLILIPHASPWPCKRTAGG